jgi:hypothetical protein
MITIDISRPVLVGVSTPFGAPRDPVVRDNDVARL